MASFKGLAALALALAATLAPAVGEAADRRLVLVTLDGLDWREVFRGADTARAADPQFVKRPKDLAAFVDDQDRAKALMPFLHGVVAKEGALLGDRDHGSCAAVANDQWFSYPGYNEVLTGRADPAIVSNDHGPNRNVTFLEWLNGRPAFKGKVRVVGSWGAMHEIVNGPRSGVPVNAGPRPFEPRDRFEAAIAQAQADAPPIWQDTRFDTFTHAMAMDTLKKDKPSVLYVAYGDTDDFAHDGRYDQVLIAANRIDKRLAELWNTLQADPAYKGKTTMLITVDHGRGSGQPGDWRDHGKPQRPGSDAVWIGAIGPGVTSPAAGGACHSSSQIAATALTALELDWRDFEPAAGAPLPVYGK